jgi:hypothetical protein
MTIHAGIIFNRRCITGVMAFPAGNKFMLPFQRIISEGMIEILHLLDPLKRFLGMTGGAILSEFIIMNILMATGTVLKTDSGKLLHFHPIGF